MKNLFIALVGTLALTSTAFAETYQCGSLKDRHGNTVYVGPHYSVEFDRTGVYLHIIQDGFVGPLEFKMKKVAQYPDGSSFRAAGVTANYITTPIYGRVVTIVNITKRLGRELFSAQCN